MNLSAGAILRGGLFVLCLSLIAAGPLRVVPDVSFQDLDGASVTLSDFRGSVVLVNFWATWCVPCFREIPELIALAGEYRSKGLEVVGVAVDSGGPEPIQDFVVEHRMDYRILTGDLETVRNRFRISGFPTTLLLDKKGSIRKRYFGPQTLRVLKKDIDKLL